MTQVVITPESGEQTSQSASNSVGESINEIAAAAAKVAQTATEVQDSKSLEILEKVLAEIGYLSSRLSEAQAEIIGLHAKVDQLSGAIALLAEAEVLEAEEEIPGESDPENPVEQKELAQAAAVVAENVPAAPEVAQVEMRVKQPKRWI